MARKTVMDAVKARLLANWVTLPLLATNDVGATPDDGSGFVVLQFPAANEEPISTGDPGNNVFREEGGMRFVVAVPRGSGIDTLATYTDEIATIFRGQNLLDGQLRTWGASSSTIDDENDQGRYYRGSVTVLYEHDLFG